MVPRADQGPPKIVRNEGKYSAVEGKETPMHLNYHVNIQKIKITSVADFIKSYRKLVVSKKKF